MRRASLVLSWLFVGVYLFTATLGVVFEAFSPSLLLPIIPYGLAVFALHNASRGWVNFALGANILLVIFGLYVAQLFLVGPDNHPAAFSFGIGAFIVVGVVNIAALAARHSDLGSAHVA